MKSQEKGVLLLSIAETDKCLNVVPLNLCEMINLNKMNLQKNTLIIWTPSFCIWTDDLTRKMESKDFICQDP